MDKPLQEPEPQPEPEPTQKTLRGHVIPLPTRAEIMDAFRKIARPAEPEGEKD